MTATQSTVKPAKRAAIARPQAVLIKPAPLGYSLPDALPAYWFGNDPVLTKFWTAFCGQFPQGERFLIRSVRLFRDQVQDAQLQKDVSGFIGQEAHHAQAHEALNALLAKNGVPTERVDAQVRKILELICKFSSARDQMAMTAALEHFTSMFGSLTLEHPEVMDDVHPAIRPLFLWHAIEESEHKAVAFDLYQAVDGSHARLMRAYLVSTTLLVLTTGYLTASLMASDRSLFKPWSWGKGLRWMFGYGERAGYMRKMLPAYLDFFRRDFHPWQHDNSEQIEQWKPVLAQLLKEQSAPARVH